MRVLTSAVSGRKEEVSCLWRYYVIEQHIYVHVYTYIHYILILKPSILYIHPPIVTVHFSPYIMDNVIFSHLLCPSILTPSLNFHSCHPFPASICHLLMSWCLCGWLCPLYSSAANLAAAIILPIVAILLCIGCPVFFCVLICCIIRRQNRRRTVRTHVVTTTPSAGETTVVTSNQNSSLTTPAPVAAPYPTQQPVYKDAKFSNQDAPPSYDVATAFPQVGNTTCKLVCTCLCYTNVTKALKCKPSAIKSCCACARFWESARVNEM